MPWLSRWKPAVALVILCLASAVSGILVYDALFFSIISQHRVYITPPGAPIQWIVFQNDLTELTAGIIFLGASILAFRMLRGHTAAKRLGAVGLLLAPAVFAVCVFQQVEIMREPRWFTANRMVELLQAKGTFIQLRHRYIAPTAIKRSRESVERAGPEYSAIEGVPGTIKDVYIVPTH